MRADRHLAVALLFLLAVAPVAAHAVPGAVGGTTDGRGEAGSAIRTATGSQQEGVAAAGATEPRRHSAEPATGAAGTAGVTGELVARRTNGTVVEYALRLRVEEGAGVESLVVGVRPFTGVTAAEATGLESTRPGRFVWDGETARPRLVLRVDYREFSVPVGAGLAHEDWLLGVVPDLYVEWSDDAGDHLVGGWQFRSTEGWSARARDGVVAPGLWAYFGAYEAVERTTADGERIRLVVPAAAEEDGQARLDHLARVADDFDGGGLDTQTTTLGVVMPAVAYNPGYRGVLVRDVSFEGLSAGSAFLVEAGRNDTIWTEEYLHTRQEFRTTRATNWIPDGAVGYYRRLYQYRHGNLSRDWLVSDLVSEGFYSDDTLSRPSTWESVRTRYGKGPKVVAYLDWRIRALTGGDRSFEDVHRRLNDHEGLVTLSAFRDAVAGVVGNDSLDDEIDRYVTTGEFPDREAFVLPPELREASARTTTTDGTTRTATTQTVTTTPDTPTGTAAATATPVDGTSPGDGSGGRSLPGFGPGATLLGIAALLAVLAVVRGRSRG